ncbi:hypothetical protein [Cytobacillus sp. IB215665]|uniref:hypothetical protein n=1 Tax=Cytobacillus sp. IB215665 TaxID=3097357 RepID=UPI002A11FE9E|nr:hypothetical protein [Cytobacillus sp. IB215665]MDX8367795.1 hypothetical protein [Cytobacillus sp. IB215665]
MARKTIIRYSESSNGAWGRKSKVIAELPEGRIINAEAPDTDEELINLWIEKDKTTIELYQAFDGDSSWTKVNEIDLSFSTSLNDEGENIFWCYSEYRVSTALDQVIISDYNDRDNSTGQPDWIWYTLLNYNPGDLWSERSVTTDIINDNVNLENMKINIPNQQVLDMELYEKDRPARYILIDDQASKITIWEYDEDAEIWHYEEDVDQIGSEGTLVSKTGILEVLGGSRSNIIGIANETVQTPLFLAPNRLNERIMQGEKYEIKWQNSSLGDPEGHDYTYELYLRDGDGQLRTLATNLNKTSTSYEITIPEDSPVTTEAYFRITVRDEFGTFSSRDSNKIEIFANTAPSTPGVFSSPIYNEELESGDLRAFAVGAATDLENNISKYMWEVSINGANYEQVGQTSSPSFTYEIPTATSLRMRVKAVDSKGLESSYRESGTFTATKPKYYWNKYHVNTTYGNDSTIEYTLKTSNVSTEFDKMKRDIIWDGDSWEYKTGENDGWWDPPTWVNIGDVGYLLQGDTIVKRVAITSGESDDYHVNADIYEADRYKPPTITYSKGVLTETGVIGEESDYPDDGRHYDNYWYVKGSRVNESIVPPQPFSSPASNTIFKPVDQAVVTVGSSSASDVSYEFEYNYNNETWYRFGSSASTTSSIVITRDATKTNIQFRARTKDDNNVYSDWIYSDVFEIQHNQAPTVVLTTTDNRTLYENDTLTIEGQATDEDVGQVVIVRYQIDGQTERAIETQISNGTPFPFSKSITLKNGILYDGETVVTDQLEEGIAHTLKVTVEDDQGGITEDNRTFYVVLNRPPTISIDSFQELSDLIDNDTITITGTAGDPENGDVVVKYNLNGNSYSQIHNGPSGAFSFDLKLEALTEDENTVQIQAIDGYNFVTTKSLIINKSEIETPLLSSFARLEIDAPKGTAKGVLLWIQRDPALNITAEISMTMNNEPEDFQPMLLDNTASLTDEITEDTLKYQADSEKEKIILKLLLERDSVDVSPSISLISGVLD